MIRLADYVMDFLVKEGVKDVFLVPGGGSVFLNDALAQNKALNYYCFHHEQAVAMASESYARVKNELGVSLVTSGPGGTNAITGAAGSWMDSVPHLILSGQVFLNQTIRNTGVRQFGVQEINIIDIIKPITKYAIMVTEPQKIKYYLQKAIYLAKHGRPGPVWLDIPANVQNSQIDKTQLEEFNPSEIPLIFDKNLKDKVACIVKLLKQSKRPLLHAGQGIKIARAEKEFLGLVEKFKIPCVTARGANDIINSDNPLFVGRPGIFAQRGANFAVQNADFYIAIGTRLSLPQTGYNSKDYARNAFKVMVDIDNAELNKDSLNIDLKIQTDAKIFLRELISQLEETNLNIPEWQTQCKKWKEKYPVNLPEYKNIKEGINSFYFIDLLSDNLDSKDIIVTDMGFSFQTTHMGFKVKSGQKLFTNGGMSSMGWGLPAAIGASIAHGKQRVICIAGDGGFQMNIQELATIKHHNLPIKIFIYNNSGYLTMKQTFEDKFEGRVMGSDTKTGLSFPDFVKVAESYGINALRITNQDELTTNKFNEILNNSEPILCDLSMQENQPQTPKFLGRTTPEGKTIFTPFENLYPFLPEHEFKENILQKGEPLYFPNIVGDKNNGEQVPRTVKTFGCLL